MVFVSAGVAVDPFTVPLCAVYVQLLCGGRIIPVREYLLVLLIIGGGIGGARGALAPPVFANTT